MGWLVTALGAVLALAGAASIVAGIPYVRLEFGWTEVIAGSTVLSAGMVTMALGAVLFALRGIRRSLDAAGPPAGSALAIRTVLPFPEAEPEPDVGVVPPTDGAIDPLPDPATPSPAAKPRMERFKARLSTVGLPRDGAVEDVDHRSVDYRSLDPVPPVAPREATSTAPDLPDAPDAFAGSRSTLDPIPSRRGDRHDEPSLDIGPADRLVADRDPPVAVPAAEPQSMPTPSDAPTVVGRYESGGASYVLFSDGTIEVETETGTHRFASMQALKDHIEQQAPA